MYQYDFHQKRKYIIITKSSKTRGGERDGGGRDVVGSDEQARVGDAKSIVRPPPPPERNADLLTFDSAGKLFSAACIISVPIAHCQSPI